MRKRSKPKASAPPTPIPVRDPKLSFSTEHQNPWHGDGFIVSRFLDAQSLLFPEGEKFFVESVRAFEKDVPSLSPQILSFSSQEKMHSKYHRLYNQSLRREGFPIDGPEARVKRLFLWLNKFSALNQLAVTVCFEHYTAIISRIVSEPILWLFSDRDRSVLWRWHALEELEHRAVAFDVYEQVGGKTLRRNLWMMLMTVAYGYLVVTSLVPFLWHDKVFFRPGVWWQGFVKLFLAPGPLRRIIPSYFVFFSRNFHPSDLELPELGEWRAYLDTPRH